MKSITGIEYNNPEVCIKGMGTFACVCPECHKEMKIRAKAWYNGTLTPPSQPVKLKKKNRLMSFIHRLITRDK